MNPNGQMALHASFPFMRPPRVRASMPRHYPDSRSMEWTGCTCLEPATPTATVSFIEVNNRTYAVTANHVIDILNGKARCEGRLYDGYFCPQAPGVAILGPFLRAPANFPHQQPDVAICPVGACLPGYIGKEVFHVRPEDDAEWPVSHAVAVGFPRGEKQEVVNGRNAMRVVMPCIHVVAECISSDGTGDRVSFVGVFPGPPIVKNLSGMSGGLVLWTDGARYGVVGIVIEGDLISPEGDSDLAGSEWRLQLSAQRVDYQMLSEWTEYVDDNWERKRKEMGEKLNRASGRRPRVDQGERSLFKAHSQAVAEMASLARNPMIEFLGSQFKELDEAVDDEFLGSKRTEMLNLLRQPRMALESTKSEDLLRLVGQRPLLRRVP